LVVLEEAGDLRLTGRAPQRRAFELAIEVAFELVPAVIHLVDQRLDVLVRETLMSGLGDRRHGPPAERTREEKTLRARAERTETADRQPEKSSGTHHAPSLKTPRATPVCDAPGKRKNAAGPAR